MKSRGARAAVLALAIVGLVAAAGFLFPRKLQVDVSARLAVTPAVVWPLLSRPGEWTRWDPWLAGESGAVQLAGEEPLEGAEAEIEWKGGQEVGAGTIRLVDLDPERAIDFQVRFGEGEARGEWIDHRVVLEPLGDGGTKARWTVHADLGANPFARLFAPVFEKAIAAELGRALEQLGKIAAEPEPSEPAAPEAGAEGPSE